LELPERTTLANQAPKGGQPISAFQGALDSALADDNEEIFVTTDLMGSSISGSRNGFGSGDRLGSSRTIKSSREKLRPKSRATLK
jgi:hypothetical protein